MKRTRAQYGDFIAEHRLITAVTVLDCMRQELKRDTAFLGLEGGEDYVQTLQHVALEVEDILRGFRLVRKPKLFPPPTPRGRE